MRSDQARATPKGVRARTGTRWPTHLRAAFSRFLHRRRRLGHFARHPLQDALAGRGTAIALPGAPPDAITQDLLEVARDEPEQALHRLHSRLEGLTTREAAARLARHGPNLVEHEGPLPWWRHLWHCFLDPFNLLLTALAGVSWATHDLKATVVISTMVALSTALRFVQEHRSSRAAESLKALVSNTATVMRQGRREVPISKLVPGDVLLLSAGDMIPADCRVLAARDLFISQAALTGESLPVEKFAQLVGPLQDPDPLAQADLVFMGTNVVSGTATALVVHTGARSFFGAVAAHATATDTGPNAFQAGINSVSWLLIRFAAIMVPVVLLINGLTKGDWVEAFFFALAVAVGLTPEMLPMIVTSTLARGAVQLARRKVVVKRLDAIQNLGAMDVLCTDKTGTLTQDQIALAQHIDPLGRPSDEVLAFAYLNSHYQSGLKNLLDRAVLDHVELPTELKLDERYRKVDEVPFDFQRRRMSVVVAERRDGQEHHELICKGALEEMLAVCTRVRLTGNTQQQEADDAPLDDAMRERVLQVSTRLSLSGLRVVAVAMKELPPQQTVYSVADEADLVLVGYIAFLDPPKESAAPALRALSAHGGDDQGADWRQRAGDCAGVRPGGPARGAGAAGPRGAGHERRRTGPGSRSAPGLRQAEPPGQGAHRARAALAGPRRGLHGRRHQRRAGAARGRPGHLGGLGRGHCQGGGRHHPAGEEPDGAGRRRGAGPHHLLQPAEVHPHDRQLQLRQRAVGAGGQCLPAFPAHAAAAPAGAEPAL
jgi:Mg2+-importing ATPase